MKLYESASPNRLATVSQNYALKVENANCKQQPQKSSWFTRSLTDIFYGQPCSAQQNTNSISHSDLTSLFSQSNSQLLCLSYVIMSCTALQPTRVWVTNYTWITEKAGDDLSNYNSWRRPKRIFQQQCCCKHGWAMGSESAWRGYILRASNF